MSAGHVGLIAGHRRAGEGRRGSDRHLCWPRSRANVLWGLGCFLLIQALTVVLIDRQWAQIRDPGYGHRLGLLHRRLVSEPDRPLLLVIGSSRPEMGLKPDSLALGTLADGRDPLCFNFSLSGSGPFEELLCLRRLLDQGMLPRWLLIEVLPVAIHTRQSQGQQPVQRFSYDDLQLVANHAPLSRPLRQAWYELLPLPWHTHRFSILSHVVPAWLPWSSRQDPYWRYFDDLGWHFQPFKAVGSEWRQRATERVLAQYGGSFADYRISPATDSCYEELLRLCHSHDIQPLFYVMPESRVFQRLYPSAALVAIDRYLVRLQEKTGVPVIDTRRWIPEEELYLDSHHLIRAGATIFSERFGREVLRPFVRQDRSPSLSLLPGHAERPGARSRRGMGNS